MLTVRRSEDRGVANHGWLNSRHSFSFADYHDPKHMRFGPLRVINEDQIEGGTGFGQHPHRDMEIISYVMEGALTHQDSMGNKAVIKPGEIQRMSAGTGVVHAEENESKDKKTHFLQIWVMPDQLKVKPSYGQKSFAEDLEKKDLVLVLSKTGRDGSLSINQDADIYLSKLKAGKSLTFGADPKRAIWVQMIEGQLKVNDTEVKAGDGVALTEEKSIDLAAIQDAEFLLFDMIQF
ncbi:MAG: pirin family protein [Chitinophagaceae bacterium]|nr:pirin family protein [Oligoflexus sp.]